MIKLTKEQQAIVDADKAEILNSHSDLYTDSSVEDKKRFDRITELAKAIRNEELIQLLNELAVSVRDNYRIVRHMK
jgi:hypothetical protein